jgi:hypothetical protein
MLLINWRTRRDGRDMEPLSGAASVIAVIQLTGAIAQICGSYIRKVDEARQDIIHLQEEVDALSQILKSLNNLLHSTDRTKLGASNDLIDSCQMLLDSHNINGKNRSQKNTETNEEMGPAGFQMAFKSSGGN